MKQLHDRPEVQSRIAPHPEKAVVEWLVDIKGADVQSGYMEEYQLAQLHCWERNISVAEAHGRPRAPHFKTAARHGEETPPRLALVDIRPARRLGGKMRHSRGAVPS